jgi:hypothetical protein
MLPCARDPAMVDEPDARGTRATAEELAHFLKEETGYQWIQGTKPQTLAFGLTDSPAGLAAWILEKFRAGPTATAIRKRVPLDTMLANITLYWFTGAIGLVLAVLRADARPWPIPPGGVGVPMGYCQFPTEILRPPRSWPSASTPTSAAGRMERGGHFAALEQPEALAHEITEFFRPLRVPTIDRFRGHGPLLQGRWMRHLPWERRSFCRSGPCPRKRRSG